MSGQIIYILGNVQEHDTYQCHGIAQRITKSKNDEDEKVDTEVELQVHFETDYNSAVEKVKKMYPKCKELLFYKESHLVLILNEADRSLKEFVGNLQKMIALAENDFGCSNAGVANSVIYNKAVRQNTLRLLQELKEQDSIVYLEFDKSENNRATSIGSVFIQLYTDICPLACENFKILCKNKTNGYLGCKVHRKVQNGWIQLGDVVDGSGANSIAALEEGSVRDESFSVSFDDQDGGIVGFCNSGPHSNGSQFFITLGPCPWMDYKFVGIGKVIHGEKVMKAIKEIETRNQVPENKIEIIDAGVLLDTFGKM